MTYVSNKKNQGSAKRAARSFASFCSARRWIGVAGLFGVSLVSFGATRAEAAVGEESAPVAGVVPTSSRTERLPKRLEGVNVEEKLEQLVPNGVSFRDDTGKAVLYDQLVKGDLPTILTLNYSDCPMLCSLQLTALVTSLREIDLNLGKDYRIVTVSLNPNESVERARDTKNRYLTMYGRPDAPPDGWKVLTGTDKNVHSVAGALGFVYGYNEERNEYVHPAAFVIATPTGVISRYIYGLEFDPKTLRLSLVEASQGKIGGSVDRLILYCFQYDATEGHYAPVAMNIMRVSAGTGALALGALLTGLWRNDIRRKRKAASSK